MAVLQEVHELITLFYLLDTFWYCCIRLGASISHNPGPEYQTSAHLFTSVGWSFLPVAFLHLPMCRSKIDKEPDAGWYRLRTDRGTC